MGLLRRLLFSCGLVLALPLLVGKLHGAGPVLIAYGGFNETMAPLWVGVEKGLFKKYGADAHVLQTRSGPIMMATLASGGVPHGVGCAEQRAQLVGERHEARLFRRRQ